MKKFIISIFMLLSFAALNVKAVENEASIGTTSYETLEMALKEAKEGETVTLLTDVTGNYELKTGITIDLNGKTITALGTKSIFTVNAKEKTINLKNGTLTGANVNGEGGAMLINYVDILNIDNVNFVDNKATQGGGAIKMYSGKVELLNSKFTGNSATVGGAIQVNARNGASVVRTYNTTFENNTAVANGGAIASSSGNVKNNALVILDNKTKILSNKARNGGAVWISGSNTNLNVINAVMDGNTATVDGGAIWSNITFSIESGKITNNKANRDAGAVYIYVGVDCDENVKIGKNVTITGNSAKGNGGAFLLNSYASHNGIVFTNEGSIYNNTASKIGDDIYSGGIGGNTGIILNLGNINPSWTLDCNHNVDGWYYDGYYAPENGEVNETKWNETDYAINAGKTVTGKVGLKAAHVNVGTVLIHFIDEDGNTLLEDITLTGLPSESYKSTSKEIEGYTLIEVKGEETGNYISRETIEITYIYQFTKGQGTIEEPILPTPEPIEPPHTSVNNSIYALIVLVNALGISVLLKKREN